MKGLFLLLPQQVRGQIRQLRRRQCGERQRPRDVDRGQTALKEINGELERFAGLLLAWLNGYERVCERPGAKRRVFVSKVCARALSLS